MSSDETAGAASAARGSLVALPARMAGLPRSRRWAGLALTAGGLPLLTLALERFRDQLALASVLLVYLLAVAVIGAVGGVLPAMVAALGSFLLANWYFTPPFHTLAVESRDTVIALVVFVIVAALVSATVDLNARNRAAAERSHLEAALMAGLTTAQVDGLSTTAVLDQVRQLFGMTAVALREGPGPRAGVVAAVGPPITGPPSLSVRASPELWLVAQGPETFAPDQRLLHLLAATAARALEGQRLSQQAARAEQLAATDRARAALLAAVGHDLRTPLSGIKAAASTLLQDDVPWTREETRELLGTIEDATDRLTELVSNLLAVSRIQAGALTVQPSPVGLDEVVGQVLLHAAGGLTIALPDDLPLVLADPGLLERVVANLVDNALRFSPPGRPVEIGADSDVPADGHPTVRLHVRDHGPGVPMQRWGEMFLPFQRLGDTDTTTGLGLGLATARGFTEAMNGTLTPSETPGGGLTMTVTLPVVR